MAEISYQFIETPFRRYGFKTFYSKDKVWLTVIRTPVVVAIIVIAALVLSGQFDYLAKQEKKRRAVIKRITKIMVKTMKTNRKSS